MVLNNLDLCILIETWIKEDDTTTPSRLCPSGYKALFISRHGRIGGGIAIVYKNDLNIIITRGQPFKTMESTYFSINTGNKVINLIAIYSPPDINVLEFCNEVANLLESKINSSGELILLRDFNTAVNKPSEAEPATFLDMLNSFNLINRVDKPHSQAMQYSWPDHSWCQLKYNPKNQDWQALFWSQYCSIWYLYTLHCHQFSSRII